MGEIMLTPNEIDRLADAIVARLAGRVAGAAEEDPVGDCHDAAGWLRCSVPTIERLVQTKRIPSFTVGRLRRFRRSEVLAAAEREGGEQ